MGSLSHKLTSIALATSLFVSPLATPLAASNVLVPTPNYAYADEYQEIGYESYFEALNLAQIGGTIDFANGLVGNILSQPATSRHGSFSVRDGFLWLVPGSDAIAGAGLAAVGGGHNLMNWELPLNSGEWNIGDNDLVEFNFQWQPESTRPGAHSFDISFMDGVDRILTIDSHGQNTNLNSGAHVRYYTGNHLFADNAPAGTPQGTNTPIEGARRTALSAVPMRDGAGARITPVLDVTVSLNLALQEATFVITGHGAGYSSQTIALPSGNLTGLQFGASRAAGNNWNRQNGWSADIEAEFGSGIRNISVRGAQYEGVVRDIAATEVVLSGAAVRNLEFGAGADETLFSTSITAVVNPQNATDRTVTWTAYPAGIVDLAVNGNDVVISAIAEGQVVVTATANGGEGVASSATVNVAYVPPIGEPMPEWSTLFPLLNAGNYEDWNFEFGTNFPINDLWGFTGGSGTGTGTWRNSVSELDEAGNPINHFMQWNVVGQSGGRNTQRTLPEEIQGSASFVTFDWRPGEVGNRNPASHEDQNVYDVRIIDADNVPVLSLRMGRTSDSSTTNNRAIGAFAGLPMGGRNMYIFDHEEFALFENLMSLPGWHNRWFTIGINVNFDEQEATVTVVERGSDVVIEEHTIPINATELVRFEMQGHRTAANNLNFTGNGFDNLFFFSQYHTFDTIVGIVPPAILGLPPVPENISEDATFWQNWFITVLNNETPTVEEIGLPTTMDVEVASGEIVEVEVEWNVTEVPWHRLNENPAMEWNQDWTGVYTFAATIIDNEEAYNRMLIVPEIFVENRLGAPLTNAPRTAEWLDRGVVAVPVNGGEGNLIQWRILATEYLDFLTFNVFRNDDITPLNDAPITTLNFVDFDGIPGDAYRVEVIQTGEMSPAVVSLEENFLEIQLQRPTTRTNPAVAFGAPESTPDIHYYINDMSVADVTGNGRYEILVKWYPSQQQDPGLAARHTGETIFDLYTLEGELLWRINLGINISSSAHHLPFSFYNMNQGESAQFAVKTADGTRVYLPDADGIVRETLDGGAPVYVIGGNPTTNPTTTIDYNAIIDFERGFYVGNVDSHPDNVWIGGTTNPVTGIANTSATGRINNGPEFFTVFDGLTGLPIDTIEYFAPYGIRRGRWGDNNQNRSDRFLGGLAYMPKGGVPGAVPYPTIIEGRQHYGPHHVVAMQLIDGNLETIWEFHYWDWFPHQFILGNHQLSVHHVDGSGYDSVILGSFVLNHRGEIAVAANGTRGTLRQTHGDALHVSVMRPDSNEVYMLNPQEAPGPDNLTLSSAVTGRPIFSYDADSNDVGRAAAGSITPLPGFEVWSSDSTVHNIVTGEQITIIQEGTMGYGDGEIPVNHMIWWTGSLYRQFLDSLPRQPLTVSGLRNFNFETNTAVHYDIITFYGTTSNNGTKANPGLQADILGDWREEVLVGTSCHTALRIYITDIPTDNVIYTLMHDPAYRLAINWQNNVYNQPPHLGFYLGHTVQYRVDQRLLPVANLRLTNAPEVEVTPSPQLMIARIKGGRWSDRYLGDTNNLAGRRIYSGEEIEIFANVPLAGYRFSHWEQVYGQVAVEFLPNIYSKHASFIMPNSYVTVRAVFVVDENAPDVFNVGDRIFILSTATGVPVSLRSTIQTITLVHATGWIVIEGTDIGGPGVHSQWINPTMVRLAPEVNIGDDIRINDDATGLPVELRGTEHVVTNVVEHDNGTWVVVDLGNGLQWINARMVTVIDATYETEVYVVESIPTASVRQTPGNTNELTVTVTQTLSNGETNIYTEMIVIRNNGSGTYEVGPYRVFVNTQGNTQIREIRIVD